MILAAKKSDASSTTKKSAYSKSGSSRVESPRTGDETNAGVWIGLAVVALAALAGIVFYRRKNRES